MEVMQNWIYYRLHLLIQMLKHAVDQVIQQLSLELTLQHVAYQLDVTKRRTNKRKRSFDAIPSPISWHLSQLLRRWQATTLLIDSVICRSLSQDCRSLNGYCKEAKVAAVERNLGQPQGLTWRATEMSSA